MARYRSDRVGVLGSSMHFLEAGAGPPVLLLHGNPTCSHLWRHVLTRAAEHGSSHRWIAPDLIGMGGSEKPDIAYRVADHIAHLDGFITALGLSELVVVGHDWGVFLALDLLRRRPDNVRAVAFLEGHLRSLPGWDFFDDGGRELFQRLRTPGLGEHLVLAENFFLDTLLPGAVLAPLSEADLQIYRAPYPDPASRRPLLQWAREIPVGGAPADVAERFRQAEKHFTASNVPKLLVTGEPGVLIDATIVARCRADLTELTVVDVGGPAGHFLPEDRPGEVATALVDWVHRLPPAAGNAASDDLRDDVPVGIEPAVGRP